MIRLPIHSSSLLGPALTTLAFLLALMGAALLAAFPHRPADALVPLVLGFICFLAGTALALISVTGAAPVNDTHSDSPTIPPEEDLGAPEIWSSDEELQDFLRHV
jgi:hypothetical protein